MPHISIQDAARIAGVHRTTIVRAIESGKMSAIKLSNGRQCIDPSELARAFPPERPDVQVVSAHGVVSQRAPSAPNAQAQSDTHIRTSDDDKVRTVRDDSLAQVQSVRIEEMGKMIRRLESDNDDLRTRLDKAEQDRGIFLRLLEDKRQPPTEPASHQPPIQPPPIATPIIVPDRPPVTQRVVYSGHMPTPASKKAGKKDDKKRGKKK